MDWIEVTMREEIAEMGHLIPIAMDWTPADVWCRGGQPMKSRQSTFCEHWQAKAIG